jgi:hypothetical protein
MTDTYKRHSKCPTCSQWVSEEVEIKTLPKSVEVLCVPDDNEDETWTITMIDHINDETSEFVATNMKDARWFITNVAFKMHRPEHRISVVFPTSRFDRATRLSHIEFNDWADEQFKERRKGRLDWFSDMVAKSGRSAVRGSNATHRLGFEDKDVE